MNASQKSQPSAWVSPAQLAAEFDIPQARLRALATKGLFPAPVLFGERTARWSRAAVDAWVKAQAGAAHVEAV